MAGMKIGIIDHSMRLARWGLGAVTALNSIQMEISKAPCGEAISVTGLTKIFLTHKTTRKTGPIRTLCKTSGLPEESISLILADR